MTITDTLSSKSFMARPRRITRSPYVTGACASSMERNLFSSSAVRRPRFGTTISGALREVRRTKNSFVSLVLENRDHGNLSSTDSDLLTMPSRLNVTFRGSCIPKPYFQMRLGICHILIVRQNEMKVTVANAPIHSWLAIAPPAPMTAIPSRMIMTARFAFGEAPRSMRRHSSYVS